MRARTRASAQRLHRWFLPWTTAALAALVALGLVFQVQGSAALGLPDSYPNIVFSDGFESGSLAWDGLPGNGTVNVVGAAAHAGAYGLRMTNTSGQFGVAVKALPSPLVDSSTTFWVRVGAAAGFQSLAQARDASSGVHLWDLYYDGAQQRLDLFAYRSVGSDEIATTANSAPVNTWFKVEVQYTATATGGAQLAINGVTQASWRVSGDYTRTANLQRIQLWNDAVNTTDFDDVQVAVPATAGVPGAPTALNGTPGSGTVGLSWTAPASNGGSPITGYRVTPYVGGAAQTPILTGSTSTSYTVTGLTNGTAYTFTVAAINANGTGPESAATPALTPVAAATPPGAPTGVAGTVGDTRVTLSWTAPASDGGSAITGYRITPYIGAAAQTPVATGTTATTFTVTGLTNGTAYTFRVAATNAVGTGADSTASGALTPRAYTNVVFTDGFESGTLASWDGITGSGSQLAWGAAARTGLYGLRLTNTTGQFGVVGRGLPNPLVDSSTSFWFRVGTAAGMETLAQARDGASAAHMWDLYYDGAQQRLVLDGYRNGGSDEIATTANSAPVNTWVKVEVQYTATATGGMQLYVNDVTRPAWGASGDYTRTTNLQRIQLWDDVVNTTDFDDVSVSAAVVVGAPGAPTAVAGTPGNGTVALTWTAPASDGGHAITGYRVTPSIGGTPQSPILTGSAATSYTVTGLTNGTGYTFTVAAINSSGPGPESAASATLTPAAAATLPSAPSGVTGTPGDGQVALHWNAPTSPGGTLTSYRITPFVGTTAQTPINTGSSATDYAVTGLANGTAYTFTVAATNSAGTGPASPASAAITPRATYTNVLFTDGFESGGLGNWNGAPGNGSALAWAAAARTGGFGLRFTNVSGQYGYLVKTLAAPQADTSVSFWVRVGSAAGFESIAQARDASSSAHMWDLYYDGSRQGLVMYAYTATGSTEVFTGVNTAAVNTWVKVEVQYTATTTGGAQLYVNGQTRTSWGVTGDYTRTANLGLVQLWNDAVNTTDFDDVTIATPPPAGSTVPGAPTNVVGAPRDGGAALTWTAPASNGGSAISRYRITPFVSGSAQTAVLTPDASTSYTVTGLTNGFPYTFTVAAVNGVGTGAASAQSAAITPAAATTPAAPTAVVATPGNTTVALSWTAGSDGGAPITGYRVTPYVGATAQAPILTGSAAASYTVTGLTNGTAYTFRVAAINAVGTSPDSAASAAATPRPPLGEYTNVVFADGLESGTSGAWAGPLGTGSSSTIAAAAHTGAYGMRMTTLETQYAYMSHLLPAPLDDSLTEFWVRLGTGSKIAMVAQARDGASQLLMWQLSYDGTRKGFLFYPFGTSGTSTEVFTGANTATAGTWVKVDIQYTATAAGGSRIYVNGQTQPAWGVSGNYTRTSNLQRIQLWNEGLGPNDFDDVSVAGLAPAGASLPSAPTAVNVAPLDRAVSLSWTAPASDGGSAISSYKITPYIGGVAQSPVLTGTTATTFVVAGLVDGTAYTFTVAAMNGAGAGPASAMSAAVTPVPAPPPGAPTNVAGVSRDRSVALTWTAPASDGGTAITGYRVTPYIGATAQTAVLTGSTATNFTVTGLTNGTTYTFTVSALNASGPGADSDPSAPVTPAPPTPPSAPSGLSGAPKDRSVALTWIAPASDGGTPITGYRITPYVGGTAQTAVLTGSTATGFTVTGLTNGTAYTFTVAAINAVGASAESPASAAVTPAVPPANPIVLENQQAGTTSWQLTIDHKAENHQIEGYASAASVNKGSSINLMVNLSSNAQYTMDVYRMGWYPTGTNPDGTSCAPSCGGRLMQHIGPLNGGRQANCPTVITSNDPQFGMTECNWTPSYTLNVPSSWTSGNYIVKLKRLDGLQLESYMTFVVRDDASTAAVVYSLDVTTWQAYNFWGGAGNSNVGYDLYARFDDVTLNNTGGRAYTVSFDRPYTTEGASDGAGEFFVWDYPMIRWMESKGYDMTYISDTDLAANPAILNGHRVFVNVGHDEYYSDAMRNTVTSAIGSGVNMAFFSANNFYYRVQLQPNAAGVANHRMFCDKNALAGSTTFEWRLVSPAAPENQIGGVMLQGVANDRNFLVADASSWIYAGTNLKTYTGNGTTGVALSGTSQNGIAGLVGYEFDSRATTTPQLAPYTSFEPAGVRTVGHSYVPAADGNGFNTWSDATLYTASSGATVFSAGTIQWSFGVDNGYNNGYCNCGHTVANAASQRITSNILDRFTGS